MGLFFNFCGNFITIFVSPLPSRHTQNVTPPRHLLASLPSEPCDPAGLSKLWLSPQPILPQVQRSLPLSSELPLMKLPQSKAVKVKTKIYKPHSHAPQNPLPGFPTLVPCLITLVLSFLGVFALLSLPGTLPTPAWLTPSLPLGFCLQSPIREALHESPRAESPLQLSTLFSAVHPPTQTPHVLSDSSQGDLCLSGDSCILTA